MSPVLGKVGDELGLGAAAAAAAGAGGTLGAAGAPADWAGAALCLAALCITLARSVRVS